MEELKYRHSGFIKNGVQHFDNPEMMDQQKRNLEGKRFVMIMYDEKELEPISANDRAYYFGGIIQELEKCDFYKGESHQSIHEKLMEKFWGETHIRNGKEKLFVPSISKFNVMQFNEHIERVMHFAATDLDIVLKSRQEYYTSKRFKMI